MKSSSASTLLLVAVACSGDVGGSVPVDAAIADSPPPSEDAEPDAEVCDAECQFAATFEMVVRYSPADQSADRLTYDVGGVTNSPVIEFRYDEANGTFEHRLGGACLPVQDNPDFVRILVRALGADLVGCSVQASWDTVPFECPPAIIDILNGSEGFDLVLPTDEKQSNPESLCDFIDQLHFPPDTFAWWQVTFFTNSASVTKRLNFYRAPL